MAEAAGVLDDLHLAERAVRELRPYRGLVALSGISVVTGPVDGYLAVGERYGHWLRGHRARLGF